jgi:hypothetical protein
MDVYALVEQGLTEEECWWIIDGDDHDELAQLHEITLRLLAEIDFRPGELVTLLREGSTALTPWVVRGLTFAGRRPPVEVLAAGDCSSLLLSSQAWGLARGDDTKDGRPTLGVCIGKDLGLSLRLAGDDDLARHYA